MFSHVDVRVRDRARATAFYDAILGALGLTKSQGERWIEYSAVPDGSDQTPSTWFGITVEPEMTPGSARIALSADSCEEVDRVTTVVLEAGARNIEGPEYTYGPDYYAVFFEDPDGNKLEICCYGQQARAGS